MKDFPKLILAISLALLATAGLAAEPQPSQPAAPAQTRPAPATAYLGVEVGPLPPALAVQLPPSVPKGQGVLISRVEPGTPAEAAGLRPYDLLLSYDDQRLYAPDQLSRLVALDRVGRAATLELVRGGEILTIQATLGEAPARPLMGHPPQAWPFGFFQPTPPSTQEQRQGVVEESFESLNVEKLEDGRYRASIEYLDKDGNKREFKFEGSREELRRQIGQTEEMAPAARKHLLNALDMKEAWPMPQFWGPLDFQDLMRAWRNGEWMR